MEFRDDQSFSLHFGNEKLAKSTLKRYKALRSDLKCISYEEKMKIVESNGREVFKCGRKACGKRTVSCKVGSFFYRSTLKCCQPMRLGRCWLQRESREAAVHSTKLGFKTVSEWFSRFNVLVTGVLYFTQGK